MDKKKLREKYEELYQTHKEMADRLRDFNPETAEKHDAFARAYQEILGDLNK